MGSSSYSFLLQRLQVNQKHGKEEIIVMQNSWREMLLELPHENTGIEALHFQGEAK
jgi:nitrogen fixation protein